MSTIDPIEVIDFPGMKTVVVRVEGWEMARIHEIFDHAFTALGSEISKGTFTPTGPAFARYDEPPTETVTMEIGFPVMEPLAEDFTTSDLVIKNSSLPECRLAVTKHHGSYDLLAQAWPDFMTAIEEAGLEYGVPSWEAYDTMPTPEMDPADLITGLALPVKEHPEL